MLINYVLLKSNKGNRYISKQLSVNSQQLELLYTYYSILTTLNR
ncbi:hypothetical protein KL86DYS1_30764 [uncultured Dysgonomonas sp.]|uniref:Transposase n=1 Tax=uncultured Dysgonomonas sp. TaxID=206096 RepID=A0A212JXE8_9BACT|nr:hypothetical protein KL86DYS1_30764 [uncultured Dysgonomonas sp.]